jgi:hypothetical protein
LYQSSLPLELERIVEKALAKDRGARYQTAKDLSVDLKRLKQHLEVEAELERSITPEEESRRTRPGAGVGVAVTAMRSRTVATPTNQATVAHTVSSAEYVVGEIKRHKIAAVSVLAVIVASLAAVVYYSYLVRAPRRHHVRCSLTFHKSQW